MAYPIIESLPPFPVRGDTDFSEKANAHVAALPPWTDDVNAAGAFVETKAGEVDADATAAANSATTAQDAEAVAVASANFKGDWSTLTGSLSVPASVRHSGQYWQLLVDVADVTTSEPGVSADWASVNTSTAWTAISTSQTLGARRYYAVDFGASPLTLTLPASPAVNDFVQFYTSAGEALDSVMARNGQTIMGLAEDLVIDYAAKSLHMVFNGTDWRIVS